MIADDLRPVKCTLGTNYHEEVERGLQSVVGAGNVNEAPYPPFPFSLFPSIPNTLPNR